MATIFLADYLPGDPQPQPPPYWWNRKMETAVKEKAPRVWKKRWPAALGGNTLGNKVGVAILEFTIILPLLVGLLIPMVDFGQLAYFAIEVASAANAGAHYGAQSATTASDYSGMKTYASNDASNVPGWQTPTATSFCQCSGSTVDCSSSCSGARLITYVQVNTSATVTTLLPYPGIPSSFHLTGQAITRVAN